MFSVILKIFEQINIFTPVIPYIAQAQKIKQNRSSQGFSKKISLIVLMASVLRIFFWFGKRFHYSLLLQSILMIFMQIYLLNVAVKYTEDNTNTNNKYISTRKNFLQNFWEWNNILIYIACFGAVTIILSLLSLTISFKNVYYVEILGTLSSLLEAVLALPQILENYRVKSTKNLSYILITCWLVGDCLKCFYYYESKAPMQLLYGGLFQIISELFIVYQIYLYSKKIDYTKNK